MLPIVTALLQAGLAPLANAILNRGTAAIEKHTGIKLDAHVVPSTEDMVALKKYQLDNEVELLQLQIDSDKVAAEVHAATLAYIGDARAAQTALDELAPPSLLKANIQPVLAITLLATTMLTFSAALFVPLPIDEARSQIVIYVLGVLSTITVQIVSYYFGSSAGSKAKEVALLRKS